MKKRLTISDPEERFSIKSELGLILHKNLSRQIAIEKIAKKLTIYNNQKDKSRTIK